ncbi:MAG: O-antigen ligase family protein [Gaiellaceae bacterium]
MNFPNQIRIAIPRFGISPQTLLTTLAVSAVTFYLAYDNGSYFLPSRNTLAIAVWWAVIVGIVLGLLIAENLPRASLAIAGGLAALAAWTFASVFWAASAENAFNEFNRVSLFLGVFVLTVLVARRNAIKWWCAGLEIAVALIALVALISRFFPGTFPDQGLVALGVPSRLSFPLGYWNGLAIFLALGVPLLLHTAISSRNPVIRGLAIAPIPAIVSVAYLASSRGGGVTALVGIIAFVALTNKRWSAGLALFWAGLGSVAAIAVLISRKELVNGPFGTSLVEQQGRSAAILVGLACVLAGATYAVSRMYTDRLSVQPNPWLGRGFVISLAVVAIAGIVASHPVAQFHEFKRSPSQPLHIESNDYVRSHLTSARGSGRWQFWASAIDQWESHPVLGNGAGSYESWWLKHAPFFFPVKDAHSLYLQSLGELGIIGLLLTLGLTIGGTSIGVVRTLRDSGEERVTLAALTASFAAFSVAAGIDWMWELTAVTVFALILLALLSDAAGKSRNSLKVVDENGSRPGRRRRFGLGVTALVGVWLLICAQGVPLFAQLRISDSEAAVNRGNTAAAIRGAMDAKNLQPWASSPYLQLALVYEREGLIRDAHGWIKSAIKRDPQNWELWYVAAKIEVKLGNAAGAQKSLGRAYSLNPKSTFFGAYKPGSFPKK